MIIIYLRQKQSLDLVGSEGVGMWGGPGICVGLGNATEGVRNEGKYFGVIEISKWGNFISTDKSMANWTLLIPWQTEHCPCSTPLLRVLLKMKEDVSGTAWFCSL